MKKLFKMIFKWLSEEKIKLQETEKYFTIAQQESEWYKKWERDR